MATSKTLETTTISIEMETGTDKYGNPVYKKKNISGIRSGAELDKIVATVDAITMVLKQNTRNYFLNETSRINNN